MIDNILQRIRAYLNNNNSKRGRKKKRRKPTLRALVIADNREALKDDADEIVEKTGQEFVGVHSRLVAEMMHALTTQQKADLEKRRKQWVEKGPPPEARRL